MYLNPTHRVANKLVSLNSETIWFSMFGNDITFMISSCKTYNVSNATPTGVILVGSGSFAIVVINQFNSDSSSIFPTVFRKGNDAAKLALNFSLPPMRKTCQ